MNQPVNSTAFRRLLRERCLSGEDLRGSLGLSPSTLAKLYRGDPVSDSVFQKVVLELQKHPVVELAQELVSVSQAAGDVFAAQQ